MRCYGVLLSLISLTALAADGSAALQWHWQVIPANAHAGDQVEIVFNADVAAGYILYGSDFNTSLGPRPTKVWFEPGSLEPIGPLQAIASSKRQDKSFGTEYTYFQGQAELRQKARLLIDTGTIRGRIDGQTCLETDGSCELFRQPFTIALD